MQAFLFSTVRHVGTHQHQLQQLFVQRQSLDNVWCSEVFHSAEEGVGRRGETRGEG